jgi:FAD synthase
MQVIYSDSEIGAEKSKINKKTAVALGNFDDFHIGHMLLLEKIKQYAAQDPKTRAS